MTTTKEFGKIKSVYFGRGGYQDAMLGYSFEFGGESWGVGTFYGTWAHWTKGCKWTREDQRRVLAEETLKVAKWMEEAGVDRLDKLKGIPVEVTFENHVLKSWRVLKEVL